MATEYGGTYGDQSWREAQPPYQGLPGHDDRPPGRSGGSHRSGSHGQRRRGRVRLFIGIIALAIGVPGLAFSLFGVVTQLLPRQFTAGQQRRITDWEYGKRWRELPAEQIFPRSVSYPPPAVLAADSSLGLTAQRIGIARQSSCLAATDAAAAAVLDRGGCSVVLRATYVDGTDSYVVTVGAAVMPGMTRAKLAAQQLDSAGRGQGLAPGVRTVPFLNTPAAWFTNQRRQLSGAIAAGTYVVLYTVGYADSRPREPISGDGYAEAEMTDAGAGVARSVLSVLAAPVPAPHCPGTPGC